MPWQAILCPECFPTPRPRAPSLLRGRRAAPSPHLIPSQAEGMLGQRVFRSMRVSSPDLQRLGQASSSSPKPNSDFPRNVVHSQGRCPGKEAFTVCGFRPPQTGLRQASAARRTFLSEYSAFAEALAWSEQHFAAASSARLQSRQGRRALGSSCLLGLNFPGSLFASWFHPARRD